MYYQTKNPHGGDHGADITLDCSANVHPLGAPPEVLAAAAEALKETHRYPDPGCRELVKAIAAHEGVPEVSVLCGNGASELIFAFASALRPGLAAAFAPTFSEYAAAVALRGGRMALFGLKRERAFLPEGELLLPWLHSLAPQALFLCNPNNPTGRLLDDALLEEVLEQCRIQGIRVMVDECFLDFTAGTSLKGKLNQYPNLLLLKAFTKSYGMAGLRLGYALCGDTQLLSRMAAETPPWSVSGVAQAAGLAALDLPDFPARGRELAAAERPKMKAALEALGLWVCPSEANFLLFQGPPGLPEKLRAFGAAVRDCSNFPGLGRGWYRTAVRTGDENRRLLAAMRECV